MDSMLKKRRTELGLTLEEVGDYCGVGKSTVRKWEVGIIKNMKRNQISKLSEILQLSPLDLINYNSEDYLTEIPMSNIVFDDYFPLRYYSGLSAGSFEELLEAEPDSVVYVPIIFQSKKKRLHAFKVNDTSMNNVIPDGSIVVIEDTHNNTMRYSDGTIIIAFMDGTATVKRLYSSGNQIMLMPDSSDKSHMPILITQEQQLIIIGKVIWHMNPEDIADKCY
ncbi:MULTISPECIES: LexA family transcriptional regulator [Terrabacteria group]|uniref:LexA family protein n=1 Tax=Bacillati TaxID=1783272 RepID=UPI001C6E41B3|nr:MULTISPECIES: LexA family transcriptional regulator [Terrabacteria group]MBW9212827.1 LexA family transcriptional regulator [Trueperella sp. zg.1013]